MTNNLFSPFTKIYWGAFLSYLMAMCLPQVVSAGNVFWTGATSTNWNTASNWNTTTVPTSADHVYINGTGTNHPIISSGTVTVMSVNIRYKSLTISSGATLKTTGDGSTFAYFDLYDGASLINNGTLALETSAGGACGGWLGLRPTTTITNNGTIRINTTNNLAIEMGNPAGNNAPGTGTATFTNNACGKLLITAGNVNINAATVSNVNNAGLIQTVGALNGSGILNNQSGGVLKYSSKNVATNSSNGSVIVNDNPTNSTIFTYTGSFTGTVNGIYTNSAATTLAGTFTAPNTFVPSGLPTGSQTLYAKITPSSGACSYVVPFTYTAVAAPSITTQPTSGSACSGSSKTFTVAGSNSPTGYQWQVSTNGGSSFSNISNTSPYSNVTTATLSISNVTGFNGYQYRCIVSNGGGSATSNAATLTVNTLPSITTQPTAQTTCAGTSVSFTVAATGTGLSYQWRKGVTNVGTNSPTYSIGNPTAGDAGNYSVVVSGTCSPTATSNSVALTVNTPPSITSQPTAQTACAGSNVSFSVAATGTGLSYQWKKGTTNVGTNSATYTIPNSSVGDAGNYSVVVSGTCSPAATSNSVALTVNTPPSISTQPTTQTTCVGSSVSFNVAATGTNLSYQWKKGASNVGTNSATYTISNPNSGDAGNYSVVVSGACSPAATSNSVALTINTAPSITTQPTAQTACVGGTASFSVAATGTSLSYQWKKGITNVGTNTATYTIPNSSAGDAVNYSVVVSGTCSPAATSNSVALTVNTAPSITTQPYSQTTCAGNSVSFSVAASGTNLSYQWKKGTTNVGTNSATYTIASPISGDAGNYSVVVSGTCSPAETSNSVALTVNTAPSITTQPTAQAVCDGSPATFSVVATGTNLSYQWKKGTTNVGTNTATYTIPAASNGDVANYSVVIGGACSPSVTSNSVPLSISPAPNATIAYPTPLCTSASATSVQLSGSNTGTYSASPAGLSIDVNTGQVNPSSSTAGTYSITYTIPANGTCPSFSTTANLNILDVPAAASISASSNNVCAGTPVTLTATAAPTYTASEYLWYKNGVAIYWGFTPTFTVGTGLNAGSDDYAVEIVYAGYSCVSLASASTTVITNSPTATITPTGATTFCANTPTTLNAPAGMAAYVWKRGSTTVGTSASYIPTVSGNHNVTVTDPNGCTKTSPIIGISIKSVPPASAGADKALCVGSQTAIGSTGSNLYTYTWSPATGLSNAYISNPTTSSSGTYTLSVNNPANGCSNTDAVVITSLSIPQTPTINTTQNGNLITISSNTPGASSINWYKDGAGLYSNQAPNSSISVQPSNPTKAYTVRSRGENGCLSMPSAAVNVRIGDEKGGDLLISQENVMEVYPNPVTQILNVKLQNSEENEGKLLLYNNMGQLVFAQNISLLNGSANETLDLQHLAAGIYTLTFQTVSSNFVQKVVKD